MEKLFKQETKDYLKTLNEKAKAVSYVSIGAIDEHLVDGYIRFAIDRKDTLQAKVNYWEYYDNDQWKFFGDLTGKHRGDVHINVDSTGVYGFFNFGSRTFEILSTNVKGTAILVEYFPSRHKCVTIQNEKPKSEEIELGPRNSSTCDLSKIRVVVAYTAAALSSVGNNLSTITNRVNSGINIFNNANAISAVNEPKAELELAGIVSTNYVEHRLNFSSSNANFDQYFNSIRTNLKTTKISYKADILVLLTGYPNWGNSLFGVANAIGPIYDSLAYVMVQIGSNEASETFAHEVGHILNGTHETAHQYGWRPCPACGITETRYTIMSSYTDAQNKIVAFRWSNPNVNDGSVATGTSIKNNSLRMKNHAPIVAGFRENPNSQNAVLSGPTHIYSMGTYSYFISAGCPDPSTITWHKSLNGTTWTFAGSASTGISEFFYPGYTSMFYVRCTMHYPNGNTIVRFWTTQVYSNPYKVINDRNDEPLGLTILPNPSSEEILLKLDNIEKINQVKCYNEFGEEFELSYNILKDDTEGKILLSAIITELRVGTYNITVSDGRNISSSKFVKL